MLSLPKSALKDIYPLKSHPYADYGHLYVHPPETRLSQPVVTPPGRPAHQVHGARPARLNHNRHQADPSAPPAALVDVTDLLASHNAHSLITTFPEQAVRCNRRFRHFPDCGERSRGSIVFTDP